MWLEYALGKDESLVSIDDVKRGRNNYYCPYCQGELVAKKGKIKAHHFAHIGETCNPVKNKTVNLPLFWGFDLILSRDKLNYLKQLESNSFEPKIYYKYSLKGIPDKRCSFLKEKGIIDNISSNKYELTNLGKVILKKLSLLQFSEVQELLCQKKLEELKSWILGIANLLEHDIKYKKTKNYLNSSIESKEYLDSSIKRKEKLLQETIVDLKIYCAQYRKVLISNLYFLRITTHNETFYKIGVTSRDIEERIKKISSDLSKLFNDLSVVLLGIWQHRSNVEHYFKYRYENFKYPLGSLTEYFKFSDPAPVLQDLNTLKTKQLSQLEKEIIDGKTADNFVRPSQF